MTPSRSALFILMVLTGSALAASPHGGPGPGAAPPGSGARPGGAPPRQGAYPGGGHGHWYGPRVRFYYGSPYWGWGGLGPYWPGYYAPGYYYGLGYGYVPPYYVYGPPGVVTSTGGVVYIEREAGTVSTQQPEPARSSAADATPVAPPPPGAQWWYLCSSPRGAYPYVRECPGGWERVPAVPPDHSK